MRVSPFHGIRFGDTGGEPGRLAAPPYDQIDDAERDRLQALDAHHFCHLSRPLADDAGSPAEHARRLHTEWLRGGALLTDPQPSLYPYEIRLAGGGSRLGLCALIGLEAADSSIIRRHEETVPKTVAERLELLRAMRVDLEPILLLSEDSGELDRLLGEAVEEEAALAEHVDPCGHRHLLYRTTDDGRLGALSEVLASCSGVIADGHHRYHTARLYAEETLADPRSAAAAKLAVVTSVHSPGLAIDPIHRVLRDSVPLDRIERGVVGRRPASAADGQALAAEVAAESPPALAVRQAGGAAEIWQLDPTAGPTNLPAAASQMSVVLLHHTLLPQAGLEAARATDGTVLYRSDPDEVAAGLDTGRFAVGFWLPPMEPAEFAAATARGDLLPPKSTRFLPKLVSGLVWARHDE